MDRGCEMARAKAKASSGPGPGGPGIRAFFLSPAARPPSASLPPGDLEAAGQAPPSATLPPQPEAAVNAAPEPVPSDVRLPSSPPPVAEVIVGAQSGPAPTPLEPQPSLQPEPAVLLPRFEAAVDLTAPPPPGEQVSEEEDDGLEEPIYLGHPDGAADLVQLNPNGADLLQLNPGGAEHEMQPDEVPGDETHEVPILADGAKKKKKKNKKEQEAAGRDC